MCNLLGNKILGLHFHVQNMLRDFNDKDFLTVDVEKNNILKHSLKAKCKIELAGKSAYANVENDNLSLAH